VLLLLATAFGAWVEFEKRFVSGSFPVEILRVSRLKRPLAFRRLQQGLTRVEATL